MERFRRAWLCPIITSQQSPLQIAAASSCSMAWALAATVLIAACDQRESPELSLNPAVALGKRIFEDPRLSADGQVACSSCHRVDHAFADVRPTSVGVRGAVGTRNAPSLLEVRTASNFFWDGRETNLSNVVLQPFTNSVEMGRSSVEDVTDQVTHLTDYQSLIRHAFHTDTLNSAQIASVLRAYILSLPPPAPLHPRSEDNHDLSESEEQGRTIFIGKGGCSDCHLSRKLTDDRFHHTGIGFDVASGHIAELVDRLRTMQLHKQPLGQTILSSKDIAELGRFSITLKPVDLGAFRTPSLLNVRNTSPYMHDGSAPTLSDAIDIEIYYRSLERGRPINLTVEERRNLIAFLNTL